jgi:hypothetical protein
MRLTRLMGPQWWTIALRAIRQLTTRSNLSPAPPCAKQPAQPPAAGASTYLRGRPLSERNRPGAVLTGRERPGRRYHRTGVLALLPSRARRHYYQRRMPELPWLKPDARSEL